MYLKPSEIFFSQDSINNVFDKRCQYSYKPLGETLDALCEGRCSVSNIPKITVVRKDGKWVTADNRRLWVFREMERLGKCETIQVLEGYSIPSAKMTSYNGGTSVHVRGSPGGFWHNKPSAPKPRISSSSTRKPTNQDSKMAFQTKPTTTLPYVKPETGLYNSRAISNDAPSYSSLSNQPSYSPSSVVDITPQRSQLGHSLGNAANTRTSVYTNARHNNVSENTLNGQYYNKSNTSDSESDELITVVTTTPASRQHHDRSLYRVHDTSASQFNGTTQVAYEGDKKENSCCTIL